MILNFLSKFFGQDSINAFIIQNVMNLIDGSFKSADARKAYTADIKVIQQRLNVLYPENIILPAKIVQG